MESSFKHGLNQFLLIFHDAINFSSFFPFFMECGICQIMTIFCQANCHCFALSYNMVTVWFSLYSVLEHCITKRPQRSLSIRESIQSVFRADTWFKSWCRLIQYSNQLSFFCSSFFITFWVKCTGIPFCFLSQTLCQHDIWSCAQGY